MGIAIREMFARHIFQDWNCDLDRDPPLQWDRILGDRDQVLTRHIIFRIGAATWLAIPYFAPCGECISVAKDQRDTSADQTNALKWLYSDQ